MRLNDKISHTRIRKLAKSIRQWRDLFSRLRVSTRHEHFLYFQRDGHYRWPTCSPFVTEMIGYMGWIWRKNNRLQHRLPRPPSARRISFSTTLYVDQRINGAITAWLWATPTLGKSPPGLKPSEITSWVSFSLSSSLVISSIDSLIVKYRLVFSVTCNFL